MLIYQGIHFVPLYICLLPYLLLSMSCGRFTASQSGWGGKGPLEATWSNPPAQAGTPRAGCPGPCPDCSKKEDSTSLDSLWQSSVTCTVNKHFLMFRWNLLCFSLCPLPRPGTDHHWRELGSPLFAPFLHTEFHLFIVFSGHKIWNDSIKLLEVWISEIFFFH